MGPGLFLQRCFLTRLAASCVLRPASTHAVRRGNKLTTGDDLTGAQSKGQKPSKGNKRPLEGMFVAIPFLKIFKDNQIGFDMVILQSMNSPMITSPPACIRPLGWPCNQEEFWPWQPHGLLAEAMNLTGVGLWLFRLAMTSQPSWVCVCVCFLPFASDVFNSNA